MLFYSSLFARRSRHAIGRHRARMRCFVSVAFTSNRLVSGGSYAQAFVRASYAAMRDCKDAALIRLAVCFLEVLFLGGRGAARPLPWRARRRSTYGMVQLYPSLGGRSAVRPTVWCSSTSPLLHTRTPIWSVVGPAFRLHPWFRTSKCENVQKREFQGRCEGGGETDRCVCIALNRYFD